MNPNEPATLFGLFLWLDAMSRQGSFPHLSPIGHTEPCDTPGSVLIWFSQIETPHLESVEQSAKQLWLHEGEVFSDMQYPANALLRLRIEQARDLIGSLTIPSEKAIAQANSENPLHLELGERFSSLFDFPNTTFQEIVSWLLFEWWQYHGRKVAMRYFLRARRIQDLL